MTTTAATSTTFAAFALWGSTSSGAAAPALPNVSNPTNAHTEMVGGKVQFENDNYTITAGDDNTVTIHNKNTGETYQAWGDPHVNIDGQHAFDFWGTTTFSLDDGTKVTINTTPWANNPAMTLSSKVTITSGDYGVQISGVDTNKTGDLKFDEAKHFGGLLDALVADGNVLHENPAGKGFLGIDGNGRIRAVDQQYINETDLAKGGAAKAQAEFGDAFKKLSSLIAITLIGSFLRGVAEGWKGDENPNPGPLPPSLPQAGNDSTGAAFLFVATRSNSNFSFFALAGGSFNG